MLEPASALTELPIAWHPSKEYREKSRLLRFMRGCGFEDYEEFLTWSQREPAG